MIHSKDERSSKTELSKSTSVVEAAEEKINVVLENVAKRAEDSAKRTESVKRTEDGAKRTEDFKRSDDCAKRKECVKRAEDGVKRMESVKTTVDSAKRTESVKMAGDGAKRKEDCVQRTDDCTKQIEDSAKRTDDCAKRTEDCAKRKEDVPETTTDLKSPGKLTEADARKHDDTVKTSKPKPVKANSITKTTWFTDSETSDDITEKVTSTIFFDNECENKDRSCPETSTVPSSESTTYENVPRKIHDKVAEGDIPPVDCNDMIGRLASTEHIYEEIDGGEFELKRQLVKVWLMYYCYEKKLVDKTHVMLVYFI